MFLGRFTFTNRVFTMIPSCLATMTLQTIVIPLMAALLALSFTLISPLITTLVPLVITWVTTLVVSIMISFGTLKATLGLSTGCSYVSITFGCRYIGNELLLPGYKVVTKLAILKVQMTPCLAICLNCFKRGKLSAIHLLQSSNNYSFQIVMRNMGSILQ